MGFMVASRPQSIDVSSVKKAFTGIMVLVLTVMVFALCPVVSPCQKDLHRETELLHAQHVVSEAAHDLVVRGEGVEAGATFGPAADAMTVKLGGSSESGTAVVATASGTIGSATGTGFPVSVLPEATPTPDTSTAGEEPAQTVDPHATAAGVSMPVSTQTALTTIYSLLISADGPIHLTKTTTVTVTVTMPLSESPYDVCYDSVATETVSVYVTVSPVPDKTVTGEESTVTELSTDVSAIHGLSDVTLPGKASTRTALYTDVSLTTGLPDATVPGKPKTQTEVETSVSVTRGLPDATVTGNPSTVSKDESNTLSAPKVVSVFTTLVVTDFWGPLDSPSSSIMDTASPEGSVALTITISDLYGSPALSSAKAHASSSALADVATASLSGSLAESTDATTLVSTDSHYATPVVTVHVSPGFNATSSAPVIVSEASKKAQPQIWVVNKIGAGFRCVVMLTAVIFLVL